MTTLQLSLPGGLSIDQYVGPWAMYPQAFRTAVASLSNHDWAKHVAQYAADEDGFDTDYDVTADGIAIIELAGMITKHPSSLSRNPGSIGLRRMIRNAVANSAVRAILLRVDSPGGTVAGTADLADEVYRAAKAKPLTAFIEDMGASAAYWVASQARRIVGNTTAAVGSIGIYGVLYDYSKAAEKQGIRAVVVRSGKYKGTGTRGEEITDEQIDERQRTIDAIHELFVASVARGRGVSKSRVEAIADGRVWIGAAGVEARLVDRIGTVEQALAELASH